MRPLHSTARFLPRLMACSSLAIVFLTASVPAAEPEPVSRSEGKAIFVYKIFLNMTWPNENEVDRFHIGIYGKDQSLRRELKNIFRGVKVRGKPVEISTFNTLTNADSMHALIITPEHNPHLKSIAEKLRRTQTLLISELAEDKRSVMINFVDSSPNRLGFEINRSSILYEGLIPSKNILLFGGTELDIAVIHKETEAELSKARDAVELQREELARRQAQLNEQASTISTQKVAINRQLGQIKEQFAQIAAQKRQIQGQNENIREKEAELFHLESSLNSIKEALDENEFILNEKESVLAKKEADIDFYSEQILQNLERLRQQRLEIQDQENQITEKNVILSEQISTIAHQRLILAGAVAALLTFCGLIIVIYRGSREKLRVNTVLEKKTAELETANEKLLQMSEAKSQFLSTMSHEIRTPLNGVLGTVELLKDTLVTEQQLDYLSTIYTSGELLLSVINDVLDYSKIEAGKMPIEQVAFNLKKLIFDSAAVFAQRTKPDLDFVIDFAEETPVHIVGDPTRIRQILLNLLSNAFKFTAAGEIRIRASTVHTGSEEKPQAAITVSDTGVGMSEEQCKGIFKEFTQADTSTTRRYGGTGLGLTISMRLAKLMDGTIELTSQQGRGSAFTLKLPLVLPMPQSIPQPIQSIPQPVQQRPQRLPQPEKVATPVERHGTVLQFPDAKVLVVEDNSVNRIVIKGFLNKLGIEPQIAHNGRQAVDSYKKKCAANSAVKAFDLILMDCEMPEMDGFTATAKIRALEVAQGATRVAIVALTAHAMDAQRQRALGVGMDEHLAKPIRLEALQNLLMRFLTPDFTAATENSAFALHEK
jgi:signal transduction histidine kinase/FixJ family two-component response regulator